jgi:heterodisulfide reductase subunit B
MAVSAPFGLEFKEIDDWNCCGATEYMAIDILPAYALIGRNLALASSQPENGRQLVAPCSACYLNLSKTDHYMGKSPELARLINASLSAGGLSYTPGSVKVRHLLDVFVNDVGFEKLSERITNPLLGLRLAPYYGCVIVRPEFENSFDNPEYPTTLDKLLKTLGAEVIDFPLKAHCCGGHMTQISENVAFELIYRLLKNASDYDTDIIVTLCPMCQLNLDAYQDNVNKYFNSNFKIPILYFTQMIGLAIGMDPVDLGIGKEFIDARPALAKIGIEIPVEEVAKKRKSGKEDLPMPKMPVED